MRTVRTKFIILFQSRAGSSFLVDALDRHPDVLASGEIIYDHVVNEDLDDAELPERLRSAVRRVYRGCPIKRQLEITRRFYDECSSQKRVVGFKTKVSDVFDHIGLKRTLERCGVRAIVMERHNLVKQVVSRLNSQRLHGVTKTWNLLDRESRQGPLTVDLQEFDTTLQHAIFDQRLLRAFADYLNVPKLRLEYAGLLHDRDAWFGEIFRFLDVEPRELDSAVLKNTDDDLQRVITNFDQLKDAYAGTEFEPMFES